jgi:hypothetical protein
VTHNKTNPRLVNHRAISDVSAAIRPARAAATKLNRPASRFAIYDFLETVYRVYTDWKDQNRAKQLARTLADELGIARRKGMNPIRVLIEVTLPSADLKQKSRWVRALEYIHSEDVSPSRFRKFVRSRGGVAGCARLAVNASRKRRRPGGDWND